MITKKVCSFKKVVSPVAAKFLLVFNQHRSVLQTFYLLDTSSYIMIDLVSDSMIIEKFLIGTLRYLVSLEICVMSFLTPDLLSLI